MEGEGHHLPRSIADPSLNVCLPLAHLGHLSHDGNLECLTLCPALHSRRSGHPPSSPVAQGLGQVLFRRSKRLHPSGNSLSLVRGIKGWGCLCGSVPGALCAWGAWAGPQDASPQACTLLLMVLFIYDIFFVFITPFLTKVGAPAPALPLPHSPDPLSHADVALLC